LDLTGSKKNKIIEKTGEVWFPTTSRGLNPKRGSTKLKREKGKSAKTGKKTWEERGRSGSHGGEEGGNRGQRIRKNKWERLGAAKTIEGQSLQTTTEH